MVGQEQELEEVARWPAPGLEAEAWEAALDIVVQRPHSVDKRLAGQVTGL